MQIDLHLQDDELRTVARNSTSEADFSSII